MADHELRKPAWDDWELLSGDGACFIYRERDSGMMVVQSVAKESDGNFWVHVSCSVGGRMPTWEEIWDVRDTFVGPERLTVQVMLPERQGGVVLPHSVDLWAPLEGSGLPDFHGRMGDMIAT